MNGALVVLGMVVVTVVASVVVYRIGRLSETDVDIRDAACIQDESSLDEDLLDILGFVPLTEVNSILQSFIKYDKQVGDITVGYINDHARHIALEFNRMPEFQRFLCSLSSNGLDLLYWYNRGAKFWKDIPTYQSSDSSIACGGLSILVAKIMATVPLEELHELLRQKIRYSPSFRRFVQILRSQDFAELCAAVKKSKALQRHYFWANDDGIEMDYGIELFKNLCSYLAYQI